MQTEPSVNKVTSAPQEPTYPHMACPDCGGVMVWADAHVSGDGFPRMLVQKKGKWLHGISDVSRAKVCTTCGYIIYYADKPDKFL